MGLQAYPSMEEKDTTTTRHAIATSNDFEKVSSADASSDLMNFFKKSKHCLSA